MRDLKMAALIEDEQLFAEVSRLFEEQPVNLVMRERRVADVPRFLESLARYRPDGLLVSVEGMRALGDHLGGAEPEFECPYVAVVHPEPDPGMVVEAIRSGANDFLHSPLEENWRKIREKIVAHAQRRRLSAAAGGRLVGLVSAKGGCGATTITGHLAASLSRQIHGEVLFLDLDLDASAARFLLNVQARYSLLDALQSTSLDESLWQAVVAAGPDGVRLLSSEPGRQNELAHRAEELPYLLRFARTSYRWSLLDLGRGLGILARFALPELDQLFLVTTPEIASLQRAKETLTAIGNAGFHSDRLFLVLNRRPRNPIISPAEIERLLGVPIYQTIPNEYQTVLEAQENRRLVSAGTRLGQAFEQFASRIAGLTARPAKAKKSFSLFSAVSRA